ncbi:hypothetical protein [Halorubrum amylolyticum]|uniref:hypothetical protein n=1 Tax=Halorubrum amylolyticum TaxID=2508724 RepID=UPI001008B438|nr:hypothetical protein [Halorubrum amylolyticum]
MPFSVTWHTLLDECEGLAEDATLLTPLSQDRFQITDVQEHRIVVEFLDRDVDETRPLQRDQFETLYERISDAPDGFDLSRLPPDADPYPAVLSLHPRFEVDESAGVIRETDEPTGSQIIRGAADTESAKEATERTEPDVDVYSDALLLIDALERNDLSSLEALDTPALINLYTVLSDIQRDANDLRQNVTNVLLDRLHHDQPVHGQFGSVQRTARRNRNLRDDEEVLAMLEDAGIDRERVLSLDRDKVDDALDVTELSESDVYDIEETEYVRKAEVDEEQRETRLQGLKDRLATSDNPEATELREEIEELESRIEELTQFKTGREYHTQSRAE